MARFSKTGLPVAPIVGPMSATASFEITGWDETTYDAPEEGPPLEGTSTAEVLIAGREGYLAGLSGEAVYAHDDAGARLTLSYALAARS